MAEKEIEQAVLDGWTVEQTKSSIEAARYFRNGFTITGLGSIALGMTTLFKREVALGTALITAGVSMVGGGVWAESHRAADMERLAVLERLEATDPMQVA